LEKVTRALTDEEKRILDQDWVGRDGSKRKVEVCCLRLLLCYARFVTFVQLVMGRQKLKKSYQYEIKWRGLDHKFNTWVSRDDLFTKGFSKLVQQFDDLEASREGAGARDTSAHLVRKHLEDIGLDGDIAQYNEISGLSGGQTIWLARVTQIYLVYLGQKIKLVIAACLWNIPQVRAGIAAAD
jgi:elongation factor 3